MNRKYDGWRKDIRYGDIHFRRPDRVPGVPGARVNWHTLRRRLKAIDAMIDVMVSLPQKGVEIIAMDTVPPTRLWSNVFTNEAGELEVMPVGQDIIDMVHEATWKTRKQREQEYNDRHDAELAEEQTKIEDIAADAASIVEHSGRIISAGSLHR